MFYGVFVHDENAGYPLVRLISEERKEITNCVENLTNTDEYGVDNIEIVEISYCTLHYSKSTKRFNF